MTTIKITPHPKRAREVARVSGENPLFSLRNNIDRMFDSYLRGFGIEPSGIAASLFNPNIDVADNGPGIPEEDKEKLFLPYFSTKDGGTGLGLAIASKIIKEHMGYLRVRDNEPRGTVFTIEIPLREG